MPDRCSVKVKIRNRLGLHARPAMVFVDAASAYPCEVHVVRGAERVDGKSIMEIMMLAATKGTELEVVAEGEQADACCETLRALVDRGFDED